MKLLEETEVQFEMADLLKRSPLLQPSKSSRLSPRIRSKGVHVTAVLRHCAVQAKILKPGERLEEDLPLWMGLGFAWEEFAASFYPEMVWQPGEQERAGVYGNPDGISISEDIELVTEIVHTGLTPVVVEEMKFTGKKAKHGKDILREWLWMHQMRAYCGFYDSVLARLHVCFINGDYKWPREAKYIRYLILFDQTQVDDTWRLIEKNKGKVKPE